MQPHNFPKRKHKRFMKWQKGKYERFQDIRHRFPIPFLLICRLLGTPPEQILIDFADNLGAGAWRRDGRDTAKQHLLAYILAHGYGQPHYTPAEITAMWQELDALGLLFPSGDPELVEQYGQWRDKHHKYWYKKWRNRGGHKNE